MEPAMTDTYAIIFRGRAQPGHSLASVRQRFAEEFCIGDAARLQELFSGVRVVFRIELDAESAAMQYRRVLRTGALCDIEPPLPDETSTIRRPGMLFRKGLTVLAVFLLAGIYLDMHRGEPAGAVSLQTATITVAAGHSALKTPPPAPDQSG
jgi:hypothetical protein